MIKNFLKEHRRWLIPVLLVVVIAPFTPFLDLAIASHFYSPLGGPSHRFPSNAFYNFVYHYGKVPVSFTLLIAACVFMCSYCFSNWKQYRTPALFLLLTFAVGAGLITNAILKEFWGRPRPRQVVEFGGQYPFRPFYSPNFGRHSDSLKSFPSGHATLGFFFFALTVLGMRYQQKALIYGGVVLTVVLGFILGLTRIAQGGHFFSDVLMSAMVMWLTALTLDWLLYSQHFRTHHERTNKTTERNR